MGKIMKTKKVSIVEHQKDADIKVFFSDKEHEQKNHHLLTESKLTVRNVHPDLRIIIEEHHNRAIIRKLRKNIPKE